MPTYYTKSGFSTPFFRSLLAPRRDVSLEDSLPLRYPPERLYNRQYKGGYMSGIWYYQTSLNLYKSLASRSAKDALRLLLRDRKALATHGYRCYFVVG
jgi:hypothetical protein